MDPKDETKEFSIQDNLPNTQVELEGKKYTLYYEGTVSESDKAFAYVAEDDPDQKEQLFQVTTLDVQKNFSGQKLGELNFADENTAKSFLNIGLQLVKNSNLNSLGSFKQVLRYESSDYIISYQSRDLKILGISMHDSYLKRIEKRTLIPIML